MRASRSGRKAGSPTAVCDSSRSRRWDVTSEKAKIVEHFGFADGESDPSIVPAAGAKTYPNQIHLGDILVGYSNEADPAPDLRGLDRQGNACVMEWLRNGSFLVIRKLSQDCAALESAIGTGAAADEILEKMMGRTKGGDARRPGRRQRFRLSADPEGKRCPLHAHIRRANPRVPTSDSKGAAGRGCRGSSAAGCRSGRARRGDPETAKAERGLVFMTYNADIGEQFEVVQRWISGGNSTGGYSGQSDPFLGVAENGARRSSASRTQRQSEGVPLDGSARRWESASRSSARLGRLSLRALDDGPSPHSRQAAPARPPARAAVVGARGGRAAIEELRAAEAEARLAGDKASRSGRQRSRIRSRSRNSAAPRSGRHPERHGGVLRTPYGVLVATARWRCRCSATARPIRFAAMRRGSTGRSASIYLGDDVSPRVPGPGQARQRAIMSIGRAQAFTELAPPRGARRVPLADAREYNVNMVQPDSGS